MANITIISVPRSSTSDPHVFCACVYEMEGWIILHSLFLVKDIYPLTKCVREAYRYLTI